VTPEGVAASASSPMEGINVQDRMKTLKTSEPCDALRNSVKDDLTRGDALEPGKGAGPKGSCLSITRALEQTSWRIGTVVSEGPLYSILSLRRGQCWDVDSKSDSFTVHGFDICRLLDSSGGPAR